MALRDFVPLNFALIANPLNWIIIILMVALAGLGLAMVVTTPAQDTPQ